VTLKLAETSLVRSRPSVPYGANFILHVATEQWWINEKGSGVVVGWPSFRCHQNHLTKILQSSLQISIIYTVSRKNNTLDFWS